MSPRTALTRRQSLQQIEQEVGVLIRRVRRVIGERARAVHPDLQPSSYLLLTHVAAVGPVRAASLVDDTGIDKGAVSRQVRHLVDLGLLTRTRDPDDGRATLLAASTEARSRLASVGAARSERFGQQFDAWSDTELDDFAARLARYNAALD